MNRTVIIFFENALAALGKLPHKLHGPYSRWLLHGAVLFIAGSIMVLGSNQVEATRSPIVKLNADLAPTPDASTVITQPLTLPQTEPTTATSNDSSEDPWQTITVATGDTLAKIFARTGINSQQVNAIVKLGDQAAGLHRLHAGNTLKLQVTTDGQLLALDYDYNLTNTLQIRRGPEGLQATTVEYPVEIRRSHAYGIISSSLFESAAEAGLSANVIMQLADIFGWDIDFALDIREGDNFSLIYEEHYARGEKLRDGSILAAEFINRGETFRAVRYTDPSGKTSYYTPEGESLRKAFLRTPVEFSRISSRFTMARRHPILNTIRAHKGVDYAAPTGTPVRATSDGIVAFKGVKGGYGNVIELQHGARFQTVYAHLSGYSRGLYRGKRVKQGEVIGYVGKTGLASGPHLHYEFRVDGAHRNPLTVKFAQAAPVDKQYRGDFNRHSLQMLAHLDVMRRAMLALNTQ